MKVLCVIPARYASTRLPGKPLSMIAGKPMIQHVYERACQAQLPASLQNEAQVLLRSSCKPEQMHVRDRGSQFHWHCPAI